MTLSVDDPTTANAADEYEIGNATVFVVLLGTEFIHCLLADNEPIPSYPVPRKTVINFKR
nr:MAG TPA: hypothetical protein [Caudoviricetes sp.]